MIDYLLNITLMADSEAARMQWIVSTQQWTVLVLMILLVAVPLLMYSRYQRLAARRQPLDSHKPLEYVVTTLT